MYSWRIVLLSLLLLPSSGIARRPLHYDPAVVELRGKLRLIYFPGPPEFESIKNGDEPEGAYILELDEPFDIEPTKNPKEPVDSEWEKKVRRVQVVIMEHSPKAIDRYLRKTVTVQGKLFHSHTAHHHATILMELGKIHGE